MSKKLLRFLDTLGSLSALVGLVLGLTSLFLDQYDLVLEPDGFAKEVSDAIDNFQVTSNTVFEHIEDF